MRRLITYEYVRGLGPCYSDSRLKRLLRKPVTVRGVLSSRAKVPAKARLWLVLRNDLVSDRVLRLFACACAERALLAERKAGREPHKNSWRALVVANAFAHGGASVSALAAARAAASATANAANAAAYAAANAAAYAAARDAERRWQVRHLLSLLPKPRAKPTKPRKRPCAKRKRRA